MQAFWARYDDGKVGESNVFSTKNFEEGVDVANAYAQSRFSFNWFTNVAEVLNVRMNEIYKKTTKIK